MTLKTHTIHKKNPQHKQIWEWQETPELLAALKQLEISTNEALRRKDSVSRRKNKRTSNTN